MPARDNEEMLRELGVYVVFPINLQLLLTQSERDVLNTIRHFHCLGHKAISTTLLRVYTGLGERTIQRALDSLISLKVLKRGKICKAGTHYDVLYKTFGPLVKRLNNERNPIERLRIADDFRGIGNEIHKSLIQEFENSSFDTRR